MARKPGLGRGLAALLGEGGEGDVRLGFEASIEQARGGSVGVVDLPVNVITRNPRQPRRAIDAPGLEELATSIASIGVVQPVIVREIEGGGYELIAGERRWRAAQKAGFTAIPAIVRKASDTESLELALVENVVRQQLNPVDEAYALRVLLEDLGVTQESLAARVGKSRSAIANKIRLLDLPAPVQESLASGSLSEGHGRALLGLGDKGRQIQLARRAVDKGLSVRQVEDEVRRMTMSSKATARRTPPSFDADIVEELRESFFSLLGVTARIRGKGAGGVVELPFKSEEELHSMARRMRS